MKVGGKVMMALFGAVLLVAGASCARPGNAASDYALLSPERGWCFSDTLTLVLNHPDSLAAGRLAVGVTHAADYPYADLWLEVTSPGEADIPRRDTLCLTLADRNGRWKGHGIGTSFQVTDTMARPMVHRSGSPLMVRHIMRRDTIRGIDRVGLFFIPGDIEK